VDNRENYFITSSMRFLDPTTKCDVQSVCGIPLGEFPRFPSTPLLKSACRARLNASLPG